MRHVDFDPSRLRGQDEVWWQDWSHRAEAETRALIEARRSGEKRDFDPGLLAELKEWLLHNVFHHKCASCEFDMVSDYYYSDSEEHYRPKSGVTEEDGGHIKSVVMSDGRPHPGYYWVAYDWQNMFPLCVRCMRNGKGTQFPVDAERVDDPTRAPDTEILDTIEEPPLLNPYRDYPEQHLKFGVKGVVTALSRKGEVTIAAFHLGDEAFMSARQQQQERAGLAFKRLFDRVHQEDRPIGELLDRFMEKYAGPKAPFSKAVRDYLDIIL